jgi:hypothetical protein
LVPEQIWNLHLFADWCLMSDDELIDWWIY